MDSIKAIMDTIENDDSVLDIVADYRNSKVPYVNFVDRYFTTRFAVDVKHTGDDYRVLIHSNRVCVITLAPSHELLTKGTVIESVSFQVSENRNTLNTKISGKRKHNAQRVQPNTTIAIVKSSTGQSESKTYKLVPGIHGKLLEMNKILLDQPKLLTEDPFEKGHIAILLPDPSQVEALKSKLMTPSAYTDFTERRSANESKGVDQSA